MNIKHIDLTTEPVTASRYATELQAKLGAQHVADDRMERIAAARTEINSLPQPANDWERAKRARAVADIIARFGLDK